MRPAHLPTRAEDLIPHRAGMLLIRDLCAWEIGRARASAEITEHNVFLNPAGELESEALVELMAQTAAAYKGYKRLSEGRTFRFGYLAGIRQINITNQVGAGDSIIIAVHQEIEIDKASVMHGIVQREGDKVAEGALKIWEEDSFPVERGSLPEKPWGINPTKNKDELKYSEKSRICRSLMDCLCKIDVSHENSSATGEFLLAENFIGFDGHFPGIPILPGVIVLSAARLMAEEVCKAPLFLKGIENAKFMIPVFPGDRIRVEVRIQPQSEYLQIHGRLMKEDRACASVLLRAGV